MVERAAEDYANIFNNVNPDREISPICMNIEDMLARLDEFETLLTNVKVETNGILEDHVTSINSFQSNFEALRKRIDNLDQFIDVVNDNVAAMESAMDTAEDELNVTDYSLKGLLLKPLFGKTKTSDESGLVETKTNLKDGEFQAVSIFKTSEHFDSSVIDAMEDGQDGRT